MPDTSNYDLIGTNYRRCKVASPRSISFMRMLCTALKWTIKITLILCILDLELYPINCLWTLVIWPRSNSWRTMQMHPPVMGPYLYTSLHNAISETWFVPCYSQINSPDSAQSEGQRPQELSVMLEWLSLPSCLPSSFLGPNSWM